MGNSGPNKEGIDCVAISPTGGNYESKIGTFVQRIPW